MSRDFISGFSSDLKDMIRLKVSLGYAESTYLERAAGFDRYCYEKYPGKGDLTQAVVMDWLRSEQDASGHFVHGKAAFVRGLGRYLASVGKTAYILPDRYSLTCLVIRK